MSGKSFPISLVVKAVNNATAPLRQVSAQLGDISKQVREAGKTLTLGVTLPLAGMATASVAAFGRFEAGMANVSTLVDTSVESMAEMERGVIAVTRAVKVQPLAEMAGGLSSIRGAGIAAADQFKVLEGSAKLAAAGLGTTEEAANIATSAINAWGLKGKEAESVYNTVFQAVNFGKMSLSEFAQGFGDVASVAAAAGVKADEYAASVAALTTAGTKASTAHTQLRAVIGGLTNQSKEAQIVFRRLGVKDFKTLIAQSGGLVPALQKVRGVIKDNDDALLDALGGLEAYSAAIGLTGNLATPYQQALGAMRSGTDGLTGAWEKQARTGKASFQTFQNEMEIVAITVGRILVPVLQQLVPVLERAAARWEGLGETGQTSIVIMAAAAAALGPTITVISGLATALHAANVAFAFVKGWAAYLWLMRASLLTAFIVPMKAAIASVWGFTAALLANPITWVVLAVAALGVAAYQLYKNWEPVKKFFMDLWETMKAPLDALKRWKGGGNFLVDSTQRDGGLNAQGVPNLLMAPPTGEPAPVFGAERPTMGVAAAAAQPPPAPVGGETRVIVDFANLPRGARVTEAPGGTAPLDLSLGYGMM